MPQALPQYLNEKTPVSNGVRDVPRIEEIASFEKETIAHLMSEMGSSVKAKKAIAAKMGISAATLYRKINRYGLGQHS